MDNPERMAEHVKAIKDKLNRLCQFRDRMNADIAAFKRQRIQMFALDAARDEAIENAQPWMLRKDNVTGKPPKHPTHSRK